MLRCKTRGHGHHRAPTPPVSSPTPTPSALSESLAVEVSSYLMLNVYALDSLHGFEESYIQWRQREQKPDMRARVQGCMRGGARPGCSHNTFQHAPVVLQSHDRDLLDFCTRVRVRVQAGLSSAPSPPLLILAKARHQLASKQLLCARYAYRRDARRRENDSKHEALHEALGRFGASAEFDVAAPASPSASGDNLGAQPAWADQFMDRRACFEICLPRRWGRVSAVWHAWQHVPAQSRMLGSSQCRMAVPRIGCIAPPALGLGVRSLGLQRPAQPPHMWMLYMQTARLMHAIHQ